MDAGALVVRDGARLCAAHRAVVRDEAVLRRLDAPRRGLRRVLRVAVLLDLPDAAVEPDRVVCLPGERKRGVFFLLSRTFFFIKNNNSTTTTTTTTNYQYHHHHHLTKQKNSTLSTARASARPPGSTPRCRRRGGASASSGPGSCSPS